MAYKKYEDQRSETNSMFSVINVGKSDTVDYENKLKCTLQYS